MIGYVGYSQGGWPAVFASLENGLPAMVFGCPRSTSRPELYDQVSAYKNQGDVVTKLPPLGKGSGGDCQPRRGDRKAIRYADGRMGHATLAGYLPAKARGDVDRRTGIILVFCALGFCLAGCCTPGVIPDNSGDIVETQTDVATGAETVATGAESIEAGATALAGTLAGLAQADPSLAPVAAQAASHSEATKIHAAEARELPASVEKAQDRSGKPLKRYRPYRRDYIRKTGVQDQGRGGKEPRHRHNRRDHPRRGRLSVPEDQGLSLAKNR